MAAVGVHRSSGEATGGRGSGRGRGPGAGLGLTARVGGWSFRHPWYAIAIWLVVVVAGVLAAGRVFAGLGGGDGPKSMESVQAQEVLSQDSRDGGTVVGVLDHVDPRSPAVKQQVDALATHLGTVSGVVGVATPYTPGRADLVAQDGKALAIQVKIAEIDDLTQRRDTIEEIRTELRGLPGTLGGAGVAGTTMSVGGDPVLDMEANDQVQHDLSRAEEVSLPLTLLILVLVFAGLVAALLPVLAAVVAVTGAMLILLGFAQFTTLGSDSVTVVTLLGLGLSVDYGLLLVARYREELAAGHRPADAVVRAWATAGRTILFSALTVAAALTGLMMFGISDLTALGAAGVAIAVTAMLVALTFTAAMLGLVKKRI